MMTWPEGRMEFVCTEPAEEGKREERWLGEVKVRSYGPGRNFQQGYKMQHPEMTDNCWPQNGESCLESCRKPEGE